jgi:hypothetical protein
VGVETLESRTLMAFSVGTFARLGVAPGGVSFQVRAADFTFTGKRNVLLRAIALGNGAVPGTIGLTSSPGDAGKLLLQGSVATGGSGRVLVGQSRPGTFRLGGGAKNASGVSFSLAGDADGNFRVTQHDLDLIRKAQGRRVGGKGYSDALDVDLDGIVGPRDLSLAISNKGASTSLRPLTLSAGLSAASDPDRNGVVDRARVDIQARTRAGLAVGLDRGPDGRVDFTRVASAAGLANITIDLAQGTTSFRARTSDGFGQSASADLTVTYTRIEPPMVNLSINDVSQTEADSGQVPFTFTVRMSTSRQTDTAISWSTANGTAVAGSDYVAANGTLVIPAGQTTGTISVMVIGDNVDESNESFFVNITAPAGTSIADGQGLGTILDDDTIDKYVDLTGSWAVRALDVQNTGWVGDLVIQAVRTNTGATLTGYFDWQSVPIGTYGRETFLGTYTKNDQLIHLEGQSLENAYGLALGIYDAKVDATGKFLTDGRWAGGIESNDWTAARAQVTESTFETGLDGWQVTPTPATTLTRVSTGGDPNGYAQVDDTGQGGQSSLVAGQKFLGNWQFGTEVPSLLCFDLNLISGTEALVAGPVIQLSGPGGTARLELPTSLFPGTGQWRTFVFALDTATWTVTSGSLGGLLGNVTSFTISTDYTVGAESIGFDNIRLLIT